MLQKIATLRRIREQLTTAATVELMAKSSGMTVDEVAEYLAVARLTRPESWIESVHSEAFGRQNDTNVSERREMQKVLEDGLRRCPIRCGSP